MLQHFSRSTRLSLHHFRFCEFSGLLHRFLLLQTSAQSCKKRSTSYEEAAFYKKYQLSDDYLIIFQVCLRLFKISDIMISVTSYMLFFYKTSEKFIDISQKHCRTFAKISAKKTALFIFVNDIVPRVGLRGNDRWRASHGCSAPGARMMAGNRRRPPRQSLFARSFFPESALQYSTTLVHIQVVFVCQKQ